MCDKRTQHPSDRTVVLIDDHVAPARFGRGRQPLLSDSEFVTLAVAQVLLGYHSERRWTRYLHTNQEWCGMFPYLPNQPSYHKRLAAAEPLLCQAIALLAARCPLWFDDVWITDATAVRCGTSRETVKRFVLAGYASYDYSLPTRVSTGLGAYRVCSSDRRPILRCLAHPKIGEQEVVAVLLEHHCHRVRSGQTLLADKGFAGEQFKALKTAMGVNLLRPDPKDETYTNGSLGRVRQWIESVNQTLKDQLTFEAPRRPHPRRRIHPRCPTPTDQGINHLVGNRIA